MNGSFLCKCRNHNCSPQNISLCYCGRYVRHETVDEGVSRCSKELLATTVVAAYSLRLAEREET